LPDYTVAALEDAIHVLDLLTTSDDGITLAQLTKSSGLVKNKVFRILFTLEKHQLVERDEFGRFFLGLKFLEFGQRVQKQTTLLEASRSIMDRLVDDTSESIFLGVISGSDALCVAARESPRSIRLYAEVGRRAPLLYGGVPKVLLAFMSQQERTVLLEKTFGLEPAVIQALESRLAQIREQGYAVIIDELDPGAHSVAAPIRDHAGQVVAAVSVAGPSHRFTEECVARYVQLVMDAAEQISQALGHKSLQSTLHPGSNGKSGAR
jgi:IclR family transcriptional regulator, KDG regulon repressor